MTQTLPLLIFILYQYFSVLLFFFDFDLQIIFDECHRAKNLCPVGSTKPTKTGLTVLELQKQLPKSRVVYASATGASEPRNMAYMTRLGMWGKGSAFLEFMDFINAVEKRFGIFFSVNSISAFS